MPPDNLPTFQEPTTQQMQQPDVAFLSRYAPYVVMGVGLFLIVAVGITFFDSREEPAPVVEAENTQTPLFGTVSLEGQSAIVWDAKENKTIFGREQTRVLPLASVSKVMTALAAHETIPDDAVISISSTALATDGESGLFLGERFLRDDLIAYMLVTSSNDAATALKEYFDATREPSTADFIWHMNDVARDLGLTDMIFVNPTGLDEVAGSPVNRGSAQSVARLFTYAVQTIPDLIDTTRFNNQSISSLDHTHQIKNTNTIIDDIPLAIGSKTGFTDSAGGNLALSFDATIGHPIVIVVLGSSREGRFSDMKKLINETREYFTSAEVSTE